jgi:hypothetical protein
VKNINLTVDDSTWANAETFASLNKTSVTNLLLDYLHTVATPPSDRQVALARLLELSRDAKGEVGPRTWTCDNLY